jgi:hypothetical protein
LAACDKVGTALTPCLHRPAAAAAVGDFAAGAVAVEAELVDALLAAVLELLELLEPPQPASNAPVASSTSAAGESLLIIGRPFCLGWMPAVGPVAAPSSSGDERTRGHGPRASAVPGA